MLTGSQEHSLLCTLLLYPRGSEAWEGDRAPTPRLHLLLSSSPLLFLFLKTGSHYVTLVHLELYVDQTSLELCLPPSPKCRN